MTNEQNKVALDLGTVNPGNRGYQRLYRMDPPLEGYEYVVASAVMVLDEPEVYLFPADPDGSITDWGELEGSLKGTLIHEQALQAAGYSIAADEPDPA